MKFRQTNFRNNKFSAKTKRSGSPKGEINENLNEVNNNHHQ